MEEKQKKQKLLTHKQLLDKTIGKRGTWERDLFEFELQMDLLGRKIKQIRQEKKLTQEELGNKIRIADNYVRIGIIYDEQDDHSIALEHYFYALEIYEELGNKTGITIDLNNIGELYIEQKYYLKAERYLLQALEIAKEIGFLTMVKDANQNISELYGQTGK